MAQSSVLHVHIDGARISQEGGLPFGFTTDQNAHDQWFREQVNQALSGPQETIPHKQVMDEAQRLIDEKRKRA